MSVQFTDRISNNLVTKPVHYKLWQLTTICLIVFIALAVAYQPVMFNFFTSDDFYIISWLDSIKHSPGALFQGVYEGTPYYRPLTNLFWFGEYLLCGTNSWLFRIIAVSLKITSSIVLGFLLAALSQGSDNNDDKRIDSRIKWSLFSASLFLVYPLHTEPINWFVCTTEVLVNLFILSSFLLYIYWRKIVNLSLIIASCAFAVCAFLTKEVAVILPLLFTVYELSISSFNKNSKNQEVNQTRTSLIRIAYTIPYWLLLGGYLVIRRLITGNFLGNWTNNVFHFTDNQSMIKAWLQSLKMMVMPLSSTMFGQYKCAYYLCCSILVGLLSISIYRMSKDRDDIRLGIFLAAWFFISLLPMLKLFLITPDLLDARYGYIASVPLCAFLMFGLSRMNTNKFLNYLQYSLLAITLAFFTIILRSNNLAWAETGKLTNSLRSDFARIHRETLGDPKIYFFNIPLQNKGVPIAGIKTIQSMNHVPFSKTNFDNGSWLLNDDQSLPIGINKHTLEQGKANACIYYWNNQDKHFHKIDLPNQMRQMPPQPYKTIPIELNGNIQELRILGNLGSSPTTSNGKISFVFHPQNLLSWPVDLLALKLHKESRSDATQAVIAELDYTNDAKLQLDSTDILNKRLIYLKPEQDQFIFIPVRGVPIWSFGGNCHTIKISFPKGTHISIIDAYAASIENLMPKISINSNNSETGINLNSQYPKYAVSYDASSIKNCIGVAIEVINGSEYFEELNSLNSHRNSPDQFVSMHSKGKIVLDQNIFPGPGLFKVRLRPIDQNGQQMSFCSDHFIVSISKN